MAKRRSSGGGGSSAPVAAAAAYAVLTLVGAVAAFAAAPSAARAGVSQEVGAKPLLQTKFEGSTDGWQTIGDSAKIAVAADAERKALRFDYNVIRGELNALVLTVSPTEIAGAKTFRFSVKTAEQSTTLAVALQEQGGGRWVAVFHAPAGKWQEVVLTPSDFALSEGENDPADANNALDLDKVESVALLDLAQLFAQAGDANLLTLFNIKTGMRSLLLGPFTADTTGPPPAPVAAGVGTALDTVSGPQVGWVGIGNVSLSRSGAAGKEERGLLVAYRREAGKLIGAVRQLPPPARFKDAGALSVTLASEKQGQVLVQVEEKGGGKYNTIVVVPGGQEAKAFTLPFADFKPADDSKDKNNQLDPDAVNQVLFLDITSLMEPDAGNTTNTLTISTLRAVPKG
jgi:Carbohydrate binding domain (family 11).